MSKNYRGINTEKDLDIAILKNKALVSRQEARVIRGYMKAREFYTPARLTAEATRFVGEKTSSLGLKVGELIPTVLGLLFRKKK